MKYADVKVGMKVKVTGSAPDHYVDDQGIEWKDSWVGGMEAAIGNSYTVRKIDQQGVGFEEISKNFPWSVLIPLYPSPTTETKKGTKVIISDRVKDVSGIFYVIGLENFIGQEFVVNENYNLQYPGHTVLGNTLNITNGTETFVLPYSALDLVDSGEEEVPPEPVVVSPLVDKGKTIKIKEPWVNNSMDEIYSSDQWKFALLTTKNEMAMPWVMCRDFLQECVGAHLNGHSIQIYGFKTDPLEHPVPSLFAPRMAIRHDKQEMYENLDVAKHIVHLFEGAMKIKKTEVSRAEWQVDEYHRVEECYVAHFSKLWLKSPQMLSLYSLLWRLGDNFQPHEVNQMKTFNQFLKLMKTNTVSNNNRKYFRTLLDKENKFKELVRVFRTVFNRDNEEYFNYKKYSGGISQYHNNSGIESMFKDSRAFCIPFSEVKNFATGGF